MSSRMTLVTLLVPLIVIGLILAAGIPLLINRSGGEAQPVVGLTAEAALESPSGDFMGTVKFRQTANGVLIMAELKELSPGGHAFVIHETGACTPDFSAAGDHFNPTEAEHGLFHPSWQRGESGEAHGGDLLNIYAAGDGSARADFLTEGVTLGTNQRHSIFDADGSSIIVYEYQDSYGEEGLNTGRRLACGVISRK